jgi:hypothetical protein
MPIAFDGTVVPNKLPQMSCGGIPEWDFPSECYYRCDTCGAVIGSIGQSMNCKAINKNDRNE